MVFTSINPTQVIELFLKLTRKGVTSSNTIDIIDQLTYNYQSHSNQLSLVGDTADEHGFKDGNTSGNDFEYDLNGNMTIDKNKEIINIEYNHLNLPTKVEFATSNPNAFTAKYISYVYDATGVKQAKYVQEEGLSGVSSIEYSGAFIYERGPDMSPIRLKFISQPEGYIEPVNSNDLNQGFDYVYQFKDHLGNIRLSYSDKNNDGQITPTTEIIEENNYYPFGLQHKGYNNVVNGTHYPFGYNGKEENDELGLEWLDFGARNYDASLGRWMNVDPLAEKMRRHSPYNYAFNNPIFFIDPDGREPFGNGEDDKVTTRKTDNVYVKYELIDDENNIHQTTWTRHKSTTITTSNQTSVTTETTSTTESITTTISTNDDGEVVTTSTRSFEEKSTKTISGYGSGVVDEDKPDTTPITEEDYDLSNNKQAEAFTNNIVDQIQANPEWNLWNETVSLPGVEETSLGIGILEQFVSVSKAITARTLAPVAGQYLGNKYRNNADHSGKSITYKVSPDGTLSKMVN